MRRAATLALALLCAALPSAAAVHKCVDARGRVTYQDEPCRDRPRSTATVDTSDPVQLEDGRAIARPARPPHDDTGGDVAASALRGEWRGLARFGLHADGRRVPDAGAAATTVLELRPDGSAGGFVDGAGCRLAGRFKPLASPSVATLDLRLEQCRDERFNRRYTGQLVVARGAREARLSLHGVLAQTGERPMTQASLDALLKR